MDFTKTILRLRDLKKKKKIHLVDNKIDGEGTSDHIETSIHPHYAT